MKKLTLTPSPSPDFTIIGISCHTKDYKFTFLLNRSLHFNFKRGEDFRSPDKNEQSHSFYLFKNPDDRRSYMLLSNHHPEGRLVPKLKGADFFLVVDEMLPDVSLKDLISRIKKTEKVLTAFVVDIEKNKEVERIIGELELHTLGKS